MLMLIYIQILSDATSRPLKCFSVTRQSNWEMIEQVMQPSSSGQDGTPYACCEKLSWTILKQT